MGALVRRFAAAASEALRARQEEGTVAELPEARHEALVMLRAEGLERQQGGAEGAEGELRRVFALYDVSGNGVLNQVETKALFEDYFDLGLSPIVRLAEDLLLNRVVALEREDSLVAHSGLPSPEERHASSGTSEMSTLRKRRVSRLQEQLRDDIRVAAKRAQDEFSDHCAEIRQQWLRYCDTGRDGCLELAELQSALLGEGAPGFLGLALDCVGLSEHLQEIERAATESCPQRVRRVDFNADSQLGGTTHVDPDPRSTPLGGATPLFPPPPREPSSPLDRTVAQAEGAAPHGDAAAPADA